MNATMREAASNLEFETATRIRDEIRRLEAVDLAIADDPFARQEAVEDRVADATAKDGRKTATAPARLPRPNRSWRPRRRG
jgi:excinuclease ABC subunit B